VTFLTLSGALGRWLELWSAGPLGAQAAPQGAAGGGAGGAGGGVGGERNQEAAPAPADLRRKRRR